MAMLQREGAGAASPRDEAVARVRRLKSWSLFGSVAAFGAFIALAASNVVGVTSRLRSTGATASSSSTPSFNSPSAAKSFFQGGGGEGAQFGGGGLGGGSSQAGGGVSSSPAASTMVS